MLWVTQKKEEENFNKNGKHALTGKRGYLSNTIWQVAKLSYVYTLQNMSKYLAASEFTFKGNPK